MGVPKRLSAEEKAKRGMFLCLGELATVTGIGQNRMRAIAKEDGFPLFEKKVTLADFQTWYRRKIGLPHETVAPTVPVETVQPVKELSRIERLSPKRLRDQYSNS